MDQEFDLELPEKPCGYGAFIHRCGIMAFFSHDTLRAWGEKTTRSFSSAAPGNRPPAGVPNAPDSTYNMTRLGIKKKAGLRVTMPSRVAESRTP